MSERDIQRTIEAGELNRSTVELVGNWCAYARVEKFGGVGLIEAETGLPIGHHSVKCDHASEAGIAAWDLREAALDFHDRNCADCKLREPAGFPNLSVLLQERENRREADAKRRELEDAKIADDLAKRRADRAKLRNTLGPIAGAILDHIDEFDEHRTSEQHEKICQSATLAPERFEPALISYIFDLSEKERWFAATGLTVLQALKGDPIRLARLALSSIDHPPATRVASGIILENVALVEGNQIGRAVPAAIDLANPVEDHFFSHQTRVEKPELLHTLWLHHRRSAQTTLDELFSSRSVHGVDLASRGVLAIAEKFDDAAMPFARTMVSKFARARLLLDDFDDDELYSGRKDLVRLLDAIAQAFGHDPEKVDAIVQEMIQGSDRKSRERCYQIYRWALARRNRERGEMISADSKSHRLAFKRMLWAPTIEKSDAVLKAAQEVLHGQPYELEEIARAEFDGLLGALLIFDDQLREHDETPPLENIDFLKVLERQNQRSSIVNLMKSAIEWASIAAKDDVVLIQKIAGLLETIPEGREELKGLLLGSIEHVGKTVQGLSLLLPHLYYALVGSSVLGRSYAATAVGEIHYRARENVPPLVYEAFSVLLWDQYVAVHKSAVEALRNFHLPDEHRGRAAHALLNLIRYYSQKANEDYFVVKCVSLLASELRRLGKTSGEVSKYLVRVLLKADPLYVRSELRWLSRSLGKTEGFADLLLRHVPLTEDHYHRSDDEVALLAELPVADILAKRAEFEKMGAAVAPSRPWLAAYIIEALTRAGAWAEARRIAQAGVDGCEPTVRNLSRRIYNQLMAIAAGYEQAIAEGRFEDLAPLAEQWSENARQLQEHNADVERRNSRRSFPSSLQGR